MGSGHPGDRVRAASDRVCVGDVPGGVLEGSRLDDWWFRSGGANRTDMAKLPITPERIAEARAQVAAKEPLVAARELRRYLERYDRRIKHAPELKKK